MDNGKITGVIFLHLTKAFDTVNHRILLEKRLMESVIIILPGSSHISRIGTIWNAIAVLYCHILLRAVNLLLYSVSLPLYAVQTPLICG